LWILYLTKFNKALYAELQLKNFHLKNVPELLKNRKYPWKTSRSSKPDLLKALKLSKTTTGFLPAKRSIAFLEIAASRSLQIKKKLRIIFKAQSIFSQPELTSKTIHYQLLNKYKLHQS